MKRLIPSLLAVTLLFSLSACTDMVSNKNASANKSAMTTLTMMMPQSHFKDFLQDALIRFESEYPDIHIEPQLIPDNQWIDLVKRKVAVREMPDLIRIDRGLIMEIGTEYFVEFAQDTPWYPRVLTEQLSSKLINGKLYGLPVGGNSYTGIVYNQALFRQYDIAVPNSLAELKEACTRFRAVGVTPLYASDKDAWTTGLGFATVAPQAVPKETWDALTSGRLHWQDVPEFKEILDAFASFRTDGYTNSNYLEATYASAVSAMAKGCTAMYITGNYFINDVLKEAPWLDLMMAAVPYKSASLAVKPGSGHIALFKSSTHQEAAQLFLDWFSRPDNMDAFNAGWSHTAVFCDQNLQLSAWQQTLNEKYIATGETVSLVSNILDGIDLNPFWDYQQGMVAGLLTADQVLESWDQSFVAQIQIGEKKQ